MKCSEREVRGRQSKQGLFPDVASDQPCPLVCEADFKAINTEKSTRYSTFVSEIQHLVKRASDEGQVVNPQLEGDKCTCPEKNLAPLDARFRVLFSASPESLLVCFKWEVEIGKHRCRLHWQGSLSSIFRLSLDGTGW